MSSGRLLEDRVAFVTGGGNGFGRALGLSDAGAAVAVLGASGEEDAAQFVTGQTLRVDGGTWLAG